MRRRFAVVSSSLTAPTKQDSPTRSVLISRRFQVYKKDLDLLYMLRYSGFRGN